jgi:IS30 family transposase
MRRGPKRRLGVEDEFWKLVRDGGATGAACVAVGIGRKTGYRWRSENGGSPPVRLSQGEHSGRFLSLLERQRIAVLVSQGHSIRQIAFRLDRAPSTVSREVRRNRLAHDRGPYDGDLAHARARGRARRPKSGRLIQDAGLRLVVETKLGQEWSPEQISAHLRRHYPDSPAWHVCHETIYQALYNPGKGGLNRTMTAKLRTGRSLRYQRRTGKLRQPRFIAPSLLIHQRPAIVAERTRIGYWEGDLITGKQNKSAIGTVVDRVSRLVRLVHLPVDHGAEQVRDGLLAVFGDLPSGERLTLTWDQGSEMALHEGIGHVFSEGVYFADPASPWQRGTNENTNRLLRQYFPKGSDLSTHNLEYLHVVEERLNNRPRKTLGWRTPNEVHMAAMA